jgi:hypothetical protein
MDWRRLVTSAVWTALALFVVLALLLAIRRLSGAVTVPLAGPILSPLAAGIAAASVLARLWLLPARLPSLSRLDLRDWLVLVGPSLALVVLLAAIMTPGTSWLAALTALLFAGVIERLFWRHIAVALRPRDSSPAPRVPPAEIAEASEEESYPANLLQQIVRTREGTGEAIHAVLRAEFQVGEQMHVLHVAFCPPLAEAPHLEAVVTGEFDADVKVTGAYSFGARLEVQLAQPALEPISLLVEVAGM